MVDKTRLLQSPAGQLFTGTGYPNATITAEETSVRALNPDLFFDMVPRYVANGAADDDVSEWRLMETRALEQMRAVAGAKPTLTNWGVGTRKCLRFGFGTGLIGAINGAIVQVSSTNWLQSNTDYTLVYVARVPIPLGAEVPTVQSPGGYVIGSRLDTDAFRTGYNSSNGRIEYRHLNATPTSTPNLMDAVPRAWMFDYDATLDTLTGRVNGSGIAGGNYTAAAYPENISTADGGLRLMFGGYGAAGVNGAFIGDLACVMLFRGRKLMQNVSESAALAIVNAYTASVVAAYT